MLNDYLLELDGEPSGRVYDANITNATSELRFYCGVGASRGFYEWLAAAFDRRPLPKSGSVITVNHRQQVISRHNFNLAWISAVGLPRLDRTTKAAEALAVSIRIERMVNNAGNGAKVGRLLLPTPRPIGDFRIRIDGLESDCAHVKSIESLNFGQKVTMDQHGREPWPTISPATVEYSNVIITLPAHHASSFVKWHEESVISQSEKSGVIEYLAPAAKQSYFSLELSGLGLLKLATQGPKSMAGSVFKVEMYCEAMTFRAQEAAIMLPGTWPAGR